MKPRIILIASLLLVLNLGLSIFLLATRDTGKSSSPPSSESNQTSPSQLRRVEASLATLRGELRDLRSTIDGTVLPAEGSPGADGEGAESDPAPGLTDRLQAIETSLARLQRAMDGVSLEAASSERAALFASENGNLKADEYFEAGKFAIAGEGYLKFLEAHPDHPDHRAILERARTAFHRAGYGDKALWAQEELMRIYPETRRQDLMTLAHMEKDAGRYQDAARHAAESANLYEDSQRYWNLLYSAWYTQLGDGNQAGLAAYRDVERQIDAAGYGDERLGERAREKIEEIERQIAADN